MHTSYQDLFRHPADFRVKYRFYSVEEGGRYLMPIQGWQSNFAYATKYPEDKGAVFMIWPEFEDAAGNVFLDKEDLYVDPSGTARMWIAMLEMRKLHRQRIRIGTKGYFMEGNHKVAECEVIDIVGLMSNPIENRS
jgi:hypothetical protein